MNPSSAIVKIANAGGFWGDAPGIALNLLKSNPDLDFITIDYLAEVSLSIMAIQKEKKPETGFATDFLDVIASLIPLWKAGSKVRLVVNAGGLNPQGCARACADILQKEGCLKKIGIVHGDNVKNLMVQAPANPLFNNIDTGESLSVVLDKLVTANAYLGAEPIAAALDQGAEIVITGRVTDPSLALGPCMHVHRWKSTDFDQLAGGTIAGHLIECGTQVTGGISTYWLDISKHATIGFPIVEVAADGSFVVTKAAESGGVVDEQTVTEQLLYEIGDPHSYLSPDVTVSFLSLILESKGKNRIEVKGAKGRAPSHLLKVSTTYRNGFKAEGLLTIFGHQALEKARIAGQVVLERMQFAGLAPERSCIECLGGNAAVAGVFPPPQGLKECVLRIAIADHNRKVLEYFTRQIAPLVTSGPQGTTGYATGRPQIREVFGFWPCLIAANEVIPKVEMVTV